MAAEAHQEMATDHKTHQATAPSAGVIAAAVDPLAGEKEAEWDTDLSNYPDKSCITITCKTVSVLSDRLNTIYGKHSLSNLPVWTVRLDLSDCSFIELGIDNEQRKELYIMKAGYSRMGMRVGFGVKDHGLEYLLSKQAEEHKEWKVVTFAADLKTNVLHIIIDGIDYGTPFGIVPELGKWFFVVRFDPCNHKQAVTLLSRTRSRRQSLP